ncbi:MAG: six-cysteine ranthipeptide SCIFF [Clostridia bacterium]|nr:six-cysteine ranthipeptide SCIFF [Clostridia bacterium]
MSSKHIYDKCRKRTVRERKPNRHIKTLVRGNLEESMQHGGCGECQTSCQSACKTSCTVGNQSCENTK